MDPGGQTYTRRIARRRLAGALAVAGLPAWPPPMMARAAQRYGSIVRDRSLGVGFFAQDPGGRPNAYVGPHGLFGGRSPEQIMRRFPGGSSSS
jgi:hypothetical protein